MKAKDIMIPFHEYLKPENTLKEAANILKIAKRNEESTGVSGLPVIDNSGIMKGFLSINDILKAVFPSYMGIMNLGDFIWDGMVENIAKKVKDKMVSDVMTTDVITIPEDAPLMECVDHILKNNINNLPVIDKQGKVIGILYERDVFYAITEAMLEENKGDSK